MGPAHQSWDGLIKVVADGRGRTLAGPVPPRPVRRAMLGAVRWAGGGERQYNYPKAADHGEGVSPELQAPDDD